MCLSYDLKPKQFDKFKSEAQKRGYIRAYKVCRYGHTGAFTSRKFKPGMQEAGQLMKRDGGWYAYLAKTGAMRSVRTWHYTKMEIKVCYAKASWIKRLGNNEGYVGIFTHLVFPDWDKGDMTIREFRAMCKEKP